MKRLIPLAALVVSPALASADTDYPHRDWGKTLTLDMSLTDATACVMRELSRKGDASIIPQDSGNDVDFAKHLAWGPKMEPWSSFKLRTVGGVTTMRIFYRHPFTEASVGRNVTSMETRCLKVISSTDG